MGGSVSHGRYHKCTLIVGTSTGPLSELSGRQLPLFLGFFIWLLLQIPIGLANNLPALLVCRMLGGCFGAAPVALVSAMYADFWEPAERGTATAVYSAAVVSMIQVENVFHCPLSDHYHEQFSTLARLSDPSLGA